ncbi:MAG: nucleotidyltransferase family protein [Bacteroidales bacterium]|nr:nucleotidyltransferase family protein [Bacteroidales bacterium]
MKEAIVLAGGKGTRLQSVVSNVPKPMAPIGEKPFLALLLQYLQSQGIEKVVLSVGYMYEIIQETFGNSYNGLVISYSVETEPLGTGGAIAKAMTMTEGENVLVLNGDSFIKVELEEIEKHIPCSKNESLLVLKEMRNISRYGSVVLENDVITAFEEKQFKEKALINAGVYVLNKDIFKDKHLPEKFSFEKDFLEKEVEKGNLKGIVTNGYFIDIGVPEDYQKAQIELVKEIEIK